MILVYLINISRTPSELQGFFMTVEENIHMSVWNSPVLNGIHVAINQQLGSKWNTAHGNRSSLYRCSSTGCQSAGMTSALLTVTVTCQCKFPQIFSLGIVLLGLILTVFLLDRRCSAFLLLRLGILILAVILRFRRAWLCCLLWDAGIILGWSRIPVSYTHLTLPTN